VKIAVITCYDQVEVHTRALVLRAAFTALPGVQTVVIKNKHKGLLRYVEVPSKIIAARFRHRPDAYVITFRGYEMLPLVLLIKGRKPLIFDEMINAVEYLHEHNRLKPGSWADKLFTAFYSWLLKRCRYILADTQAHAELSAGISKIDPSRYASIPISTDENIFYPRPRTKKSREFNVFFCAVMVPLHGLKYVLEAAVRLADNPHITFTFGGDKGTADEAYKAAIAKGARITVKPWFQLEEIADHAHRAGLAVGGPFGNTPQSQFVITTKTFQFLAAQVPVLVGRNRVNSALKDKQNSLVVPQGDTEAIVAAIRWAYDHPKELERIAAAGRRLYEQDFSRAVITEKLRRLIESL
jgi:glycosyltransferase involved in cell wall biosynthesis